MSKRLPIAQRAAPEQLPNFRLTRRDQEIIKAVNDCRALQVEQIQTLFFGSKSPAYDRLQKLFHYGYLDRLFITQVARAPAASPMVYTLTKLGAELLAAAFDYDTQDFNFPGREIKNWQTLQHILAVNTFRAAITKAAQTPGFTLLEWIDEYRFRAAPDQVYVAGLRGRPKPKPVLPDGYAKIETPQGTARFFIEVDRGTEGLEQFRSQAEIYKEYIATGQYQERFQSKVLRILVSTTTQRRLNNLKRAIAQAGAADRYWLATRDQITPHTILTAPIWQKIGAEGQHALVT